MPTIPGRGSRLELPPVPPELAGRPVAVWAEPVDIDTYEPLPPDRYPMFLETRVYQGSSGAVYPLPFHDRISRDKQPRRWAAVHLENRWLRLMVLPELGGRIHVGYDKTAGYDFFYRNDVIKPALVGLAGPWVSGGAEFNWPQHHRPTTFLPVDVEIEEHADGAVTVWCSEHEPFHRMKGMHGVTLYPDRAVVEVRVRLHNRSENVRTFLWWANVAVRVHERYQSFFPTDVHVVADHARRATTGFPRATGRYYGVDFPARISPQRPDADRLDWYRNIPVPMSYMCVDSKGDFFGGYDHAAGAGFVHWADHRISPGKKQWTWGNERFGHAWDRNLTDGGGPYVELMAGVYTDNQPDFSFLAPGETKAFRQYWYPVQAIGPVQQATPEVAVSLRPAPPGAPTEPADRAAVVDAVDIGVAVTRVRPAVTVAVEDPHGAPLWSTVVDLAPGAPLLERVVVGGRPLADLTLTVRDGGGELLRWRPPAPSPAAPVSPATEPPAPADIASVEELYLTGLHLAQYRHATRRPEPYWEEALRRDPGESRAATALAATAYERAEFHRAEALLRRAVARLTTRNPNPYDSEPHYRLGLVLVRLDRPEEAYDAFAKAAWNQAWRRPAYLWLARLCCRRGDWAEALRLLDEAIALDADHLAARDLRVLVLRSLGRRAESDAALAATLGLDPLDWWARDLSGDALRCDARSHLDVAGEYAAAGFRADALRLTEAAAAAARDERWTGTEPIAHYHRAALLDDLGRPGDAAAARRAAANADAAWCFPSGLDDERALRAALAADGRDGRAAALLGHWLYDRRRHADAIVHWRQALRIRPDDAICWRNLGIGSHNVEGDRETAVRCFARAIAAAPDDARLRYEADQLARRVGAAPATRLARLRDRLDLVDSRDDLTVELAGLLVTAGEPGRAVELLRDRAFQPWEGGEGRALGAWERAHLALARRALTAGDADTALASVRAALDPPTSLGEAPHLLANRADLYLALGDALAGRGRRADADRAWTEAAGFVGDFQDASPRPHSEKTYFAAVAYQRLGRSDDAGDLLDQLERYAADVTAGPATVDYFATSLPDLLLFDDDLSTRRETAAAFLAAQVAAGRGDTAGAADRLRAVLARDPNHEAAHDLLLDLGRPTGPAGPAVETAAGTAAGTGKTMTAAASRTESEAP
jgi:tetratricopeptide (TPR) repeat protein